MNNADAIIYRPDEDETSASQFFIKDTKLPADMSPSNTLKVDPASVVVSQQQPTDSNEDGATELRFVIDYDETVTANKLIYAAGTDNAFAYHYANRGASQIHWLHGTGTVVKSGGPTRSILNAHAALMIAGWSFLFPLGIIASRFGRGWMKERKGFWFQLHRTIQSAGLVATCVALGIMIADHHRTDTAHFSTTHGKVGLAMMVIAVSQPLNAFFRPHPAHVKSFSRRAWEGLHKTCGYASVLISVWNAFGGLDSIWWNGYSNVHDALFKTLWTLIGLVSVASLALFVLEIKDLANAKRGDANYTSVNDDDDAGLFVSPGTTRSAEKALLDSMVDA